MTKDKNRKSESLSYLTWQRLKKNKLSMFGLFIIVSFILVAILGFLITPDSSPDANTQLLELSKKPPGFKVKFLSAKKNEATHSVNFFSKMLFGEKSDYTFIPVSSYRFSQNDLIYKEYNTDTTLSFEKKINIADVVYSVKDNSISETAESISFIDFDINQKNTKSIKELQSEIIKNNITTKTFLLGTDPAGRDLLSRLMLGTRVSFSVGFISVFISLLLGIFMGAVAGYYRGKVDNIIIWIINVVWSIPTLLLVIAITLALGKGFWQVFVAVGLTMWVEVARVIRGQIISIREKEFVEAARTLGYKDFRIITRHILPNVMGPVIVISASNFASAILIEAGLSFLGIGAQPPTASWGEMINSHRGFIIGESAYLAFLPGIAIMLMVLAFVLVGNGLRDALDTKLDNDQMMY